LTVATAHSDCGIVSSNAAMMMYRYIKCLCGFGEGSAAWSMTLTMLTCWMIIQQYRTLWNSQMLS